MDPYIEQPKLVCPNCFTTGKSYFKKADGTWRKCPVCDGDGEVSPGVKALCELTGNPKA